MAIIYILNRTTGKYDGAWTKSIKAFRDSDQAAAAKKECEDTVKSICKRFNKGRNLIKDDEIQLIITEHIATLRPGCDPEMVFDGKIEYEIIQTELVDAMD